MTLLVWIQYAGTSWLSPFLSQSFSDNEWSAVADMGTLVMVSVLFAVVAEVQWQQPEAIVPFTAEEWVWAIRDGYLGNMILHLLRNGGL